MNPAFAPHIEAVQRDSSHGSTIESAEDQAKAFSKFERYLPEPNPGLGASGKCLGRTLWKFEPSAPMSHPSLAFDYILTTTVRVLMRSHAITRALLR